MIPIAVATFVIVPVLTVSLGLVVVRLVRGPTVPDRVIALDLIGTLVMGMAAAYAVATGETVYLDVALVFALIAFVGTAAFAYYLQKGRWPNPWGGA